MAAARRNTTSLEGGIITAQKKSANRTNGNGTPSASQGGLLRIFHIFGGNTDVLIAIGAISILTVLVLPLPQSLLDILLTLNITISIIVLMVSIYLMNPLEFSVFPGLLLLLTLFRLSLNVASTRLILGEADAGKVIEAFGSFVVSGNYLVGFIIFVILVIIQFVVIVKGSGRISEVAARFTLDAMPGKQMAIDADLNAGMIDETTARNRRQAIMKEADFYGAMDGASKFVKGDAIAGLIINVVNILGGFIVGIVQKGYSFSDALQKYTLLTVGDGLVTQIPALIVATAAGIVVTRSSSSGGTLDVELKQQLFNNPKVLFVAASTLLFFAIIPGLPTVPFLLLSLLSGGLGFIVQKDKKSQAEEKEKAKVAQPVTEREEKIEEFLQVDPLELEIGYGLISLVDEAQGGDLFKRIGILRKQLAIDLGVVVPAIRVRDNLQLEPHEYVFKLRGNIVGRDNLRINRLLAMSPGELDEKVDGIEVRDPAFGLPAVWIAERDKERAELAGYTVVEPSAVLSTHLQEILRQNSYKILGRQEVRKLIENMKKDYPAIVDELSPELLPQGMVQKVLQNLLKEGIPVRDLATILESLIDYARVTKNVDVLTEYVRHSLSETIARLYADERGIVHSIAMGSKLELTLVTAIQGQKEICPSLGLSPVVIRAIQTSVKRAVETSIGTGYQPIIVCAATVRPYFYRMIHTTFPNVAVLSFTELPPETEIEFIGKVEINGEV